MQNAVLVTINKKTKAYFSWSWSRKILGINLTVTIKHLSHSSLTYPIPWTSLQAVHLATEHAIPCTNKKCLGIIPYYTLTFLSIHCVQLYPEIPDLKNPSCFQCSAVLWFIQDNGSKVYTKNNRHLFAFWTTFIQLNFVSNFFTG